MYEERYNNSPRPAEGVVSSSLSGTSSQPFAGEAIHMKHERRIGYVYFIRCGRFIKIGYTWTTPEIRASQIQTSIPYKCRLLYAIRTPDPKLVEDSFHRHFADKQGNGEWFDLQWRECKTAIESMRLNVGAPAESVMRFPHSERERKRLLMDCVKKCTYTVPLRKAGKEVVPVSEINRLLEEASQ
jgi:hypothetical protein